ncbi:MAG TPA: hypothetical protein VGA69_01155 [Nitriliruptorales bacterium]
MQDVRAHDAVQAALEPMLGADPTATLLDWVLTMQTTTRADLQDLEGRLGVRFDAMDQRFDAMDQRFDAMDQRFDAMDDRFDAMDQRLDRMDLRFDRIDDRFDRMDARFDQSDQRFTMFTELWDERLQRLDGRFDQGDERFAIFTELWDERFQRLEGTLLAAFRGELNSAVVAQARTAVFGVIGSAVSISGLALAFAQFG